MKYGLMTDIHFGLKKNSTIILDWQLSAFRKALSAFLDDGVDSIIVLGDIFDNRQVNNNLILHTVLNEFIIPLSKNFKDVYLIVGNHDMPYRTTRNGNILSTLYKDSFENIHVIDEITRIDENILLVPWMCNNDDIQKLQEERKQGGILLGHLEVNGFRMCSSGMKCNNGLNASLFSDFSMVLSGHFHHRERIGNIRYLGTMIGLTWDEYNSDHGIHVLDGDKLKYIPTNISMFMRMKYEDRVYELDELECYRDKIIEIYVDEEIDEDTFAINLKKISDIAFSYSKKYSACKADTDCGTMISIELEDTQDDPELIRKYVDKNTPDSLDKDILYGIIIKVMDKVDKGVI